MMVVRHYPWPSERTCGDCGAAFTPAVYTKPDPKRDLCEPCGDRFLAKFLRPNPSTQEDTTHD